MSAPKLWRGRECLSLYSIQMCNLGKRTHFWSLIQFIYFCFQLVNRRDMSLILPAVCPTPGSACILMRLGPESNTNCSIPVSQLSLSAGKSPPAKHPRWCDSLGWIHMFCTALNISLNLSNIVEEWQVKTKRLWNMWWLATRSESLGKWSECKAFVLLLGLIFLVTWLIW